MNEFIETLKKDFSGSSDYMSGVNDGMYNLLHHIDIAIKEGKNLSDIVNGIEKTRDTKNQ